MCIVYNKHLITIHDEHLLVLGQHVHLHYDAGVGEVWKCRQWIRLEKLSQ